MGHAFSGRAAGCSCSLPWRYSTPSTPSTIPTNPAAACPAARLPASHAAFDKRCGPWRSGWKESPIPPHLAMGPGPGALPGALPPAPAQRAQQAAQLLRAAGGCPYDRVAAHFAHQLRELHWGST